MSLLRLTGATARLSGRLVLSEIDLTVEPGEFVAVCGPNGAGKSSLLRAGVGLLPLDTGDVRLGETAIAGLGHESLANAVAYLPQERRIGWNMPAREVAALGYGGLSAGRVEAALNAVGMTELADRGVAEMSGGERARVLLARLLASPAPLLLADEPIAGLDPDAQFMVLDRLRERATGTGAVIVTLHDLALAARYADRLVVMHEGRIATNGSPRAALTQDVLSSVFGVSGRWTDDALTLARL